MVINENYPAVSVEDTCIQIFILSEGRSMMVSFGSAFQTGLFGLCIMVLIQRSKFSVALRCFLKVILC